MGPDLILGYGGRSIPSRVEGNFHLEVCILRHGFGLDVNYFIMLWLNRFTTIQHDKR